MNRLHERDTTPPGGYRYKDADTGVFFRSPFLADLIDVARKHRVQNNLHVPANFAEIVEDWLCQQLPPGTCSGKGNSFVVTLDDFRRGAESMMEIIKRRIKKATLQPNSPSPFVNSDEAERRAVACINCPYNSPFPACIGCKGLYNLIHFIVGKSTRYDGKLRVCSICKCPNASAIHVTLDIIQEHAPKNAADLRMGAWRGCTAPRSLHSTRQSAALHGSPQGRP